MKFYTNSLLRKLFLPILQKLNFGDIQIRHHYTQDKIKLHSFKHKGYWFHGKNREKETLELFKKIINEGDTIIEVGGHIGYLTIFFARLIKENGKVYVFEPGFNNLPYIKQNIKNISNISLIEKAVSNQNGSASFFVEDLTGQNNSLLKNYDSFNKNLENAHVVANHQEVKVETITLDSFCRDNNLSPNLIKIDIEGAELLATEGMEDVLIQHKPLIMIEITENKETIFNIFQKHDYILFNEYKSVINDPSEINFNTFCFHKLKHKSLISIFQ